MLLNIMARDILSQAFEGTIIIFWSTKESQYYE